MADRAGLARHIATGEPYKGEVLTPLSDITSQYDQTEDTNYPNPMQYGGGPNFVEPLPAGMVQAANLAQAAGLASAAGNPGDTIDMSSASDNSDNKREPDTYGPRFTGR